MIADRLYRRFPALLMARRNLARTTLRSALAALGIVIGVVAIASLGMFGTALQVQATQSLGEIGNELTVSPSFESDVEHLDERDVRTIRRVVTDGSVVPVKSGQASVSYGRTTAGATLYGIEDPASVFQASDGSVPRRFANGALLGASLADRLDAQPGNTIQVSGRTYRVAAVLERQGGFTGLNPNNAVVVPPGELDREGYDQVIVTAESGEAANESAMAIREALNDREERVTVLEFGQITEQIGDFFGVLQLFLLGVGSISLLVAGVSILNVMLMSVVERRQEIGVLRAVGFQQRDVLAVMLAEAGLLGIGGGVIGVIVSAAFGLLFNQLLLGDPFALFHPRNILFLGLAFTFGVVTSLLSGFYPARKAANERPVEALRR